MTHAKLVAVALTVVLVGCGGTGVSPPDAREPTGSLTLRVVWPPNAALRKNLGFYRASCGYDFIPLETGVTSKLTLVKRGAHLQLAINGHVSIDWVDDGVTRGAVWGAGKIGLRQMMTTDAWYDNFRVWAVK